MRSYFGFSGLGFDELNQRSSFNRLALAGPVSDLGDGGDRMFWSGSGPGLASSKLATPPFHDAPN
jgi:hypothetical protein